jgi:hypothetical protein
MDQPDPTSSIVLPGELWRYILRLAANYDILSPWPSSRYPPTWRYGPVHLSTIVRQAHQSVQKTKRALALVSRYWRDITITFLLEDIVIENPRDLHCFVHLLELQSSNSGTDPAGMRLHPKHVQRVLLRSFLQRDATPPERESLMRSFITSCENLQVLSIQGLHSRASYACPDITDALLSRTESLRFLELQWGWDQS